MAKRADGRGFEEPHRSSGQGGELRENRVSVLDDTWRRRNMARGLGYRIGSRRSSISSSFWVLIIKGLSPMKSTSVCFLIILLIGCVAQTSRAQGKNTIAATYFASEEASLERWPVSQPLADRALEIANLSDQEFLTKMNHNGYDTSDTLYMYWGAYLGLSRCLEGRGIVPTEKAEAQFEIRAYSLGVLERNFSRRLRNLQTIIESQDSPDFLVYLVSIKTGIEFSGLEGSPAVIEMRDALVRAIQGDRMTDTRIREAAYFTIVKLSSKTEEDEVLLKKLANLEQDPFLRSRYLRTCRIYGFRFALLQEIVLARQLNEAAPERFPGAATWLKDWGDMEGIPATAIADWKSLEKFVVEHEKNIQWNSRTSNWKFVPETKTPSNSVEERRKAGE